MSFEIEGVLHKKFDTENKTDTFQAREMILEIQDGNYPQFIKFQLVQDRCSLIDNYSEGQKIKVSFDLRGREWNGKYFTNLNAWKVQEADTPSDAPDNFPTANDEPINLDQQEDDDLPF
jgi:hypothetical protein